VESQSSVINKQSPNKTAARTTAKTAPLSRRVSHAALRLQSRIGNRAFGRILQAKLTVSQPGDQYEQEADRVADRVMRMPDQTAPREPIIGSALPQISRLQRKCTQCEEEEIQRQPMDGKIEEKEEPTLQAKEVPGQLPEVGPEAQSQIDGLRGSGQPLPDSVRAFFEPRFGRDFSQVRVHTDARAAESARAVNAQAYTVGDQMAFGAGRYDPTTRDGVRLLAHELTHAVQQGATEPISGGKRPGGANGAAGKETDRGAANIDAETGAGVVKGASPLTIARFSDTGHHVIEEAALAGAGFSESQIAGTERGNIERDYSQVGVVGNTLLLCQPRSFGGYQPEEHFDNYMWDAVTQKWRTRGGSALSEQGVDAGRTPIDYIRSEFDEVANRGLTESGLTHLGNAFHTIEDFFAHSNFVELMQGDTRHGATLITGNPSGPSQSVPRILEAITPPGVKERYREQSETAISSAAPGTHTAMAHDDPTTHNYTLARRLAALVIQDLGTGVLAVMTAPEPQRSRLMREQVVAKAERYLRPPDPNDKWWETLATADAGRIDRRLDEAARKTPITVNHCALSPLKNIEASRNSPMALPLGVAIPATIFDNQVWFQVGAGVTRPFPIEPLPDRSRADENRSGPVIGAQITGTF
jgi:Domain of unknown function (DUF4157)/Heterokaryon incompatibility protein Het-C